MRFTFAFKHNIKKTSSWNVKLAEWSIQKWTKSDYFHVEVFFDNHWYGIGASGVHAYPMRPLSDRYDYITLELDVTDHQLELVRQFFSRDMKYDWSGVFFSQFLPIGLNSVEKWFCSEYLSKMAQLLLVQEFLFVHPHMVSPVDFYKLIENSPNRVDNLKEV